MGYIYKIINTINGKIYVGQTKRSIQRRFVDHIKDSKKSVYKLYRAMRKYGLDNFKVEQIEECNNKLLNEREIYWIAFYDSFHKGYNETIGGNSHDKSWKKPVDVYDLDYNFICSCESVCECSNKFNLFTGSITQCCKGKSHRAGNYRICYKGDTIKPFSSFKRKYSIIYQYNLNGDYIKSFNSILEASKITNIDHRNIQQCLARKIYQTGGFQWSYEKKDNIGKYVKMRRVVKPYKTRVHSLPMLEMGASV